MDHQIARCILCGAWTYIPKMQLRNAAFMPVCSECLQTQLEVAQAIARVHEKSANTL